MPSPRAWHLFADRSPSSRRFRRSATALTLGIGLVAMSALPAFALVPAVGDQSVNGLNRVTTTGNPAVPSGGTGGTNYCQNVITPFGDLANNANPTGFSGGGVTWTITKNDGVAETGGQSDFQYNKNGNTPSGVQGNVTNYYQLGMDVSGTSTAQGYVPSDVTNPSATAGQYEDVILTANQPVSSLSFTVLDVDTRPPGGNYRDVVGVVGSTTAGGTYNVTPTVTAVGSQVTSTLRGAEAVISGQSNVDATSRDSNATMTFATPITQVRIRYSSGALPASGNQGESNNIGGGATRQLIGISPFQYCGISVGTAKSVGTPTRVGNVYTVDYTFTLENTGGVRITRPQLFDVAPTGTPTLNGDGLAAAFGTRVTSPPTAPGTYSLGTPVIVENTTDPLEVNPAFSGSGGTTTGSLIRNDTGSIGVNERVRVTLPVTFVPSAAQQTAINNGTATWNNRAFGAGNAPGNVTTTPDATDVSTNGTSVDPTNNGRADDDTSVTPLTVTRAPAISVTKAYAGTYTDADGNGQVSVGDTLNYTAQITNTGNIDFGSTDLDDAIIPDNRVNCGSVQVLMVGGTKDCVMTYVVTAADASAGRVVNTATVRGLVNQVTVATATRTAEVVVPVPEQASIDLQKAFTSGAGPFTAGQSVTYTFTLINTGRVPLNTVSITDTKLGLANNVCGAATLAPQATTTCTRPYTITQADVNAGQLVNSASTTGTSPQGRVVTDTADARVVVQQNPAIALTKAQTGNNDADGSGAVSAGDMLTYTFTTRNTGNVTLNPVTVADPKLRVTGLACGGPLNPGVSGTCTATYTVTQADETAGIIVNTATVTGTSPVGVDVTATSRVETPVVPAPARIELVKSVSGDLTVGSTLSYRFLVTNTGAVALTTVRVDDAEVGTVTCPDTSLAPNASTTCTGSYTVTQADVDAGQKSNTATASGAPPNGPRVTDTDTAVLRGTPNAAIEITKTHRPGTFAVGDQVTYEFAITNKGNVTLNPVTFSDPKLAITAATCGSASLAPGLSTSCTRTYTITQADADAGVVNNTATTTGVPPSASGLANVTDDDPDTVPVDQTPQLSFDKSYTSNADGDGNGRVSAGDVLTYTLVATNTGNVTLTAAGITDTKLGALTCTPAQPATLAPAATLSCTGTYTATTADANAGRIDNTATATATPPSGPPVLTSTDSATVILPQSPGISLTKTFLRKLDRDTSGGDSAGDGIVYGFTIRNTGNVTLNPVTLSDPALGLSGVTCGATSLAAGISTTCEQTYTVTQADVTAGAKANTATVSGQPPAGISPVTDTSNETVPLVRTPSIRLIKSTTTTTAQSGDVIDYTFLVTNTGNVPLNPVVVTDNKVGTVTCTPTGSLAPGAPRTCTASYTVTTADVNAGSVVNTATVTGTPPAGLPNVTATDRVTVPVTGDPEITLTKSNNAPTNATVGTTYTYTLVAENTGDTTLNAVSISDPLIPTLTCTPTQPVTLAPNATLRCTGPYTITRADADRGSVLNTATTVGAPANGDPQVRDTDTNTVEITRTANFTVDKAANVARASVGDVVTYTFTVANTGNTTLTDVTVTDPLPGLSGVTCDATSVAAGSQVVCRATRTVTRADATAGTIDNTATARVTPPTGVDNPGPKTDTATVLVTPPAPTANPDTSSGRQNERQSVNPLLNDTAGGPSAPLAAATLTYLNSAGDPVATLTVPNEGSYSIDRTNPATPLFVFQPLPSFTGPATPVNYRISDTTGQPAQSTYTPTVVGVVPVARPDTTSGPQGVVQSINGLTNDSPGAANVPLVPSTLTYLNAAGAPVATITVPDQGVYSIDRTNPAIPRFVFTPEPDFVGTATPAPYRISDSNGTPARSTYTPTLVGVRPTAAPDVSSGPQNTPQSVLPLTNDAPGDPAVPLVLSTLTYLSPTGTPVATIVVPDQGTYSIDRSTPTAPRFVFTPEPQFTGTATPAPYGISDANGTRATSTYTPTIDPITPTAQPDVSSGRQGQVQRVYPLTNDDPGDPSVPLVPSTLTYLNGAGNPVDTVTVPNQGTYTISRTDPAAPQFVFTPLPNFIGTATPAPYRISDRNGTPARSTYTPTVVGVTPIAQPDFTAGTQGQVQRVYPLDNDAPGLEDVPLVPSTLTYLNGAGDPVDTITVPNEGTYTISRTDPARPQFVFTPLPNFFGDATPAPYRIADRNGTTAQTTYTPTVTRVLPEAEPDTTIGPQGVAQSIDPLTNDAPGDPSVPLVPTTVTYLDGTTPTDTITVPGQGVYTIDRSTPTAPRFVFTPEPQFVGTATPAPYGISDSNGTQATSTYTPTLIGVDPVARPDVSSGPQNTPQSAAPLANDSAGNSAVPLVPSTLTYLDGTTPVDTITVPGEGVYSIDRTTPAAPRFVFTPEPLFTGRATSVPYRISDRNGTPAESTYTPTVTPIVPIAAPDTSTGPRNRPQSVNPLTNDAPGAPTIPLDPTTLTLLDGAGLPVTTVTVPGQGVYSVDRSNPNVPGLVFTPEPDFVGVATPAPYRISDSNGTPARSTYTPTVLDTAPIARPDTSSGPQNTPQSVAPLGNDVPGDPVVPLVPNTLTLLDGNGDPVTSVTVPGQGTYTVDRTDPAAPRIVFTPLPDFTGPATPVDYRVADTNGVTARTTYTPTVTPGTAAIVVTKRVSGGPTDNDDGTFSAEYSVEVGNAGRSPLTAVQVTDDLTKTFADADDFEVTSISSETLTVNPRFDGDADVNLLDGTDTLAPRTGGKIVFTVRVDPDDSSGTFENQAVGSGTGPRGRVFDDSDSGTLGCNPTCTDIDPNDDHPTAPGDEGTPDDPTPLTYDVPPGTGNGDGGDLASTGAAAGLGLAGLMGLSLLGTGGAVLWRNRRRR